MSMIMSSRGTMRAPTLLDFVEEGGLIMKKSSKKASSTFNRRYRSHFGTSLSVCVIIWNKLDPYNMIQAEYRGVKVKHLLWALMFINVQHGGDPCDHSWG